MASKIPRRSRLPRKAEDPEYWETLKAKRRRDSKTRYHLDTHKQRLNNWCRNKAWVREQLPWKTHLPIVYPEKTQHTCSGCNGKGPAGGLKLWWQNISEPTEYKCPSCYKSKGGSEEAMPRGYEDVTSLRELVARKKQLESIGPNQAPQR